MKAGLGSEDLNGGARMIELNMCEKVRSTTQICQESTQGKKNNEKVNCRDYEMGQQGERSSKSFDYKPHFIHDCFSTLPFS